MARKLANATANAASTLRQQRLESHGSAQPDERRSQQRPESPSLAKPPQKRSQQRLASTSQEKLPRKAGPRSRIDGCRTRTTTADPVAIRLRPARAPDRISSLGRQAGELTWAVTRRGTDSDFKSLCVFICTEEQD